MISILFASFFSLAAQGAAALTVKVDSFISTGRATISAELCGHVEGGNNTAQQILIVTDPKSKGPGRYVVLTTPEGEFCSVVATATGTADVSIIGAPSPLTEVKVESSLARQQ